MQNYTNNYYRRNANNESIFSRYNLSSFKNNDINPNELFNPGSAPLIKGSFPNTKKLNQTSVQENVFLELDSEKVKDLKKIFISTDTKTTFAMLQDCYHSSSSTSIDSEEIMGAVFSSEAFSSSSADEETRRYSFSEASMNSDEETAAEEAKNDTADKTLGEVIDMFVFEA